MRTKKWSLALFILLFVACTSYESEPVVTKAERDAESDIPITPTIEASLPNDQPLQADRQLPEQSEIVVGYTNQTAVGNRLVGGKGTLPDTPIVDIQLEGLPEWVVGVPLAGEPRSSLWAVVLANGQTQAFVIQGKKIMEVPIAPEELNETPPLLQYRNGEATFLNIPDIDLSLAPPAIIEGGVTFAQSNIDGRISIRAREGFSKKNVDAQALPDGRLLVDEQDRLLFLSHPTDRYNHGVLGDEWEAAAITLLDGGNDPQIDQLITVPEDQVIEGIAPLWIDLTGDSSREIIVTLSDVHQGAQIAVYDERGELIATGPAIGQGYRWRHQIAVAPFGPQAELELVDVLTPHLGGIVEFYQLNGNLLEIVAQVPGFTSHVIGTRNLDMAVAGDFDGDDRIELVLPDQTRTVLGAIGRTVEGAEVAWTVPIGSRVITNIVAVELTDGTMAIGLGREDGYLRVWHP